MTAAALVGARRCVDRTSVSVSTAVTIFSTVFCKAWTCWTSAVLEEVSPELRWSNFFCNSALLRVSCVFLLSILDWKETLRLPWEAALRMEAGNLPATAFAALPSPRRPGSFLSLLREAESVVAVSVRRCGC